MSARLFWEYDSDSGTISANDADVEFPASNLQLSTLAEKLVTAGNQATELWTIDLGSAQSITAFALLDHDIIATDTIVLRYAADSGFSVSTGTVSVTFRVDWLLEFFTAVSRQYWRLEITKLVTSETRSAGRLLLGDHDLLTYSLRPRYGAGIGSSTTQTSRTRGGQLHASINESIKELRGQLITTDSEKTTLESLRDTNQTGKPFIWVNDWTNQPVAKSLYGTFETLEPPVATGLNLWTYDIALMEQK